MIMNDPIADMLTRIRNALIAKHDTVTMPASNMILKEIAPLADTSNLKSEKGRRLIPSGISILL